MNYIVGATSVSVDVQIVDDSGLAVTGLVAATFPSVSYSRAGPFTEQSISLSDLAALGTAHTAGGVKERSGGYYRLDLTNALFSAAGTYRLKGEASGKHLLAPLIDVGYAPSDLRQMIGTDLTQTGTMATNFSEYWGGPDPTPWNIVLDKAATIAIGAATSAIQAKTDNLPSDPADASDIAAALATIAGYIDTEIAAIKAVTDQFTAAQTEPTGVPAANATPLQKIAWMAMLARNKITQTATQQIVKADDGTTTVGTAALSDDGTTFTRGEFA